MELLTLLDIYWVLACEEFVPVFMYLFNDHHGFGLVEDLVIVSNGVLLLPIEHFGYSEPVHDRFYESGVQIIN